MSLWWAKREQLDKDQVKLIEDLPLVGGHLVVGPPGSGKTNVLLRRAQFVRMQGMPNVLVLTFTRALTEFVRTGCHTPDGREIFPPALISTFETWLRSLYRAHGLDLPNNGLPPDQRRAHIAAGAIPLAKTGTVPRYDALFVDEAQDLIAEEVEAIQAFSDNAFFVGDDRQRIYGGSSGLKSIRSLTPAPDEHVLPFHYRLVREICLMADRIQVPTGVASLASTEHYVGPKPGRISVNGPLARHDQIEAASARLRDQVRVYADMIKQGDRLGVIVPRKADRDLVYKAFEQDDELEGLSQIVRARDGSDDDRNFTTALDTERPILILTAQGSKGLEFRGVQWLFSDDLKGVYTPELYYTVVTRAKTSLDIYFDGTLPDQLAKSHASKDESMW